MEIIIVTASLVPSYEPVRKFSSLITMRSGAQQKSTGTQESGHKSSLNLV